MSIRTDGTKLREARESRWMTQGELAQRSGLSVTTISRLEHGGGVRVSNIKALAKALGVEPGDIADRTEAVA